MILSKHEKTIQHASHLGLKTIHGREYGIFFKFFSKSFILKRPSIITFSRIENKTMEKCYRLSSLFLFGVVKTEWKNNHITHTSISLSCLLKHEREQKEGGRTYLIGWHLYLKSPLNMEPNFIYVLQLGYPLLMIHSLYMIHWTLLASYSFSNPLQVS